jgi:hypothetical protein
MCDSAAHLVDHVLPDVPVRQRVLTAPHEVRRGLALRPDALTAQGRIFVEGLARWQKHVGVGNDSFDDDAPAGGRVLRRLGGAQPPEDVSVRKEALEGTCDVYPILRSDCGFPGITADQCWERDCGFDDSAPNVAWCYLPWKPDQGSGPSGIN